jgi:DNA-binding response OmpR family regulator
MKVLIIEDDAAIADVERDFLEIEGFEVIHETDGRKGMERALAGGLDLILLDLMLPGMGDYEICKAIREKIDIPILMVTARSEYMDKIRGLGLGADDYIVKPFSPTELAARVEAHINRYKRLKAVNLPEQNNTRHPARLCGEQGNKPCQLRKNPKSAGGWRGWRVCLKRCRFDMGI